MEGIEAKKSESGTGGIYTAGAMAAPAPPKPAPSPTLQSLLQYTGMIGAPEKKLKIAIITLGGKGLLVRG